MIWKSCFSQFILRNPSRPPARTPSLPPSWLIFPPHPPITPPIRKCYKVLTMGSAWLSKSSLHLTLVVLSTMGADDAANRTGHRRTFDFGCCVLFRCCQWFVKLANPLESLRNLLQNSGNQNKHCKFAIDFEILPHTKKRKPSILLECSREAKIVEPPPVPRNMICHRFPEFPIVWFALS